MRRVWSGTLMVGRDLHPRSKAVFDLLDQRQHLDPVDQKGGRGGRSADLRVVVKGSHHSHLGREMVALDNIVELRPGELALTEDRVVVVRDDAEVLPLGVAVAVDVREELVGAR